MAFCPNCGTPNTEQATKCVNCTKTLTPAAGGGGSKFKGTIMMGVAGSPGAPQQPGAPAQPPPANSPPAGKGGNDLAFQKTMMGPMVAPPPQGRQPAPAAAQPQPHDVAHAPTIEHNQPVARPPAASQPTPPSHGFSQPPDYDDTPQLPQSNATKTMMIVLGASVVVAALIVGAALFMR